ncbi:MAG: hypothetical protein A2Y45_04285 [Tenericutes bacterium GWC2_34_14]|nr:MAG: hypothetical protein A2Z84_08180 [Tenericutes bacterium GWA2_35_7]OHE28820.1 MAG: hypothetical protein A2Y45_04285 [Tenericutes bacterium GWC2_34_14]OHE33288.1 MAG: hypothetical protein A2012_06065 [Tenericutes bacterium GWE2_34_108]OHE36438.1 MAG: hypothetical protein A2Y46_08170 [Tenericutes bacterium GWF1_35_14]OHE37642.1 MAG: hypothetical protein A2Y44_03095 [Tenericutes bacterium GWF2_35_184]OHE45081.1 MAG: hypothetical protein A2221_02415 [Tenericutes bacterium RIFOXYA2_FULL_36_3
MKLKSIIYCIIILIETVLLFMTNLYIDYIGLIQPVLYLFFTITALIATLFLFPKHKTIIPFFPITVVILYTSFNVSVGMHLVNGEIDYYYSFPRHEILPIAYGILVFWYLIAYTLDAMLNKRYSKWIFPVFDVLTIPLILIGLLFSTFVSPA